MFMAFHASPAHRPILIAVALLLLATGIAVAALLG